MITESAKVTFGGQEYNFERQIQEKTTIATDKGEVPLEEDQLLIELNHDIELSRQYSSAYKDDPQSMNPLLDEYWKDYMAQHMASEGPSAGPVAKAAETAGKIVTAVKEKLPRSSESAGSEDIDEKIRQAIEAAVAPLRDRISELEVSLSEKDSKISELETQIRERDQRISELEDEIRGVRAGELPPEPIPVSAPTDTSELPATTASLPTENLSWRERFDNFRHGRSLYAHYLWHRENGVWRRDSDPVVEEKDNRLKTAAIAVGGILVAWWLFNKYGVDSNQDQINQEISSLKGDIHGTREEVEALREHLDTRLDEAVEQRQQLSAEHTDLGADHQTHAKEQEEHAEKSTSDHRELHGDIHPNANAVDNKIMNGGQSATLGFSGDTIWSDVSKKLRIELGYQPTEQQISKATNHVLNINGLTYHDARHLPVGYSYKIPSSLTSIINR